MRAYCDDISNSPFRDCFDVFIVEEHPAGQFSTQWHCSIAQVLAEFLLGIDFMYYLFMRLKQHAIHLLLEMIASHSRQKIAGEQQNIDQ